MGRPYSIGLRERVVAAVRSGMSRREAAAHFCVGVSTAVRWTAREREIGTPAAFAMGGNRPFSLVTERSWVMERLEAKPDITLRALLAELRDRGVMVSYFAVWNLVHRAGKSFKKKPARHRAGPPSADHSIELRSTKPLVSSARRGTQARVLEKASA